MDERVHRKLSAILSADVKGYSRLMEDDELTTVRTLEAYREMIAAVVKNYRGRIVDSPGDNLLAEFSSVVDAVESAVEIQKKLKTKNDALAENRRMEFRIGINLGDVIQAGERIYGDGINITARVESLADSGGICITRSAYEQVKNKLTLTYEDMGAHNVKNIKDPVQVYRIHLEPGIAVALAVKEKQVAERKWQKETLAVLLAILVMAWALRVWKYYWKNYIVAPPANSIAVLPFDNMTGDPNQDHLADGLSENIITLLSQIPEMSVPARSSTFRYKGKPVDVKQVGRELRVRHVLEGSIQRAGNRLRVTVQLIDTKTGNHIWSERYDRELKDILTVQDEVSDKILAALQVKLTKSKQARAP